MDLASVNTGGGPFYLTSETFTKNEMANCSTFPSVNDQDT